MNGIGFLLLVLAIACVFYIIVNYDSDESYDDLFSSIKDNTQSSYDLIDRIDREFIYPTREFRVKRQPDYYLCSNCETRYLNKPEAHACCMPRPIDDGLFE